MTQRRRHIIRLAGLGVSVLIVLGTVLLYFSFIHDAHPVVEDSVIRVIGVEEEVSMLDSAGLYRPLKEIYPEGVTGLSMDSVRLHEIESSYQANPYIRSSRVYFDKKRVLKVDIRQRIPAIRIRSSNGGDYYIDREGISMPVSRHYTPRVIVATGNIPLLEHEKGVDSSAIHKKIFDLAAAIEKDEFMKSFISEINIDAKGRIYMHPLMGDYKIRVNDLNDIEDKFENLKLFLREGLSRTGWDAYTELIIDYNHQIIGKKILNP